MQEKQIIQLIKNLSQASLIGDDSAYLKSENLLVSSDALVEGIHFVSDILPYYLGWKTAAVNISDISAMGGIPKYLLLAASLPNSCTDIWLEEFMRGLNECCAEYKVLLIGGDLTASDKIYLCGTILGTTENHKVALRSQAQIGDKIIVSGFLGNSSAGLYAWQNNLKDNFPNLIKAHFKPKPRVYESLNLIKNSLKPFAMMDSSDGLLDCLQQISEQSQVKIKIDLDKIPISASLIECAQIAKINYWQWVLAGGEDYELVASTSEINNLENWHIIGEITAGKAEIEFYNQPDNFDLDSIKLWKHFA